MVGTIGGYVGLFLGYSVLQIPIAIATLVKQFVKWYSDIKSKSQKEESNFASMNTTKNIQLNVNIEV